MAVDEESALIDANLNRPAGNRRGVARPSSLFNFKGVGFLAGDFPDGITRVDGVPAQAEVRVLHRDSGEVVATTLSALDGTWRVAGLNENMLFDVVGRKNDFNDVIVSNVQPVLEGP